MVQQKRGGQVLLSFYTLQNRDLGGGIHLRKRLRATEGSTSFNGDTERVTTYEDSITQCTIP